jgi:hypothetical protein
MKLGDAIGELMRVATRIPGGAEAEVHTSGPATDRASSPPPTSRSTTLPTINTDTGKASEYFGIIKAHPRRDPNSWTHRAAREDADDYLRRWSEEDSG